MVILIFKNGRKMTKEEINHFFILKFKLKAMYFLVFVTIENNDQHKSFLI
jgi:hypothetical protein